jgi:NAD(P)-dependent dehydrogenase (short-subunit alcohol dehydrogenase family)
MATGELQSLRALVTGGTKGIGHALAARLHEERAIVYDDRPPFAQRC